MAGDFDVSDGDWEADVCQCPQCVAERTPPPAEAPDAEP
jgi:hypothetical protein